MKQTGRVIFQAKDLSKILLADNQIVLGQVSGKFRNTHQTFRAFPIVGDLVQGSTHDTDHFIIEDVLPRHSFLQRKVAGQRQDEQGIAANIDTVFITTSANEEFNLARLERLTTLVWDSGATPVFVLTKTDLRSENEIAAYIQSMSQHFIGLSVITSNHCQDPCATFMPYLKAGKIVTFIGSSGVGKSTLINQLVKSANQSTKEIREHDARGKHTTTNRELFVLPNGSMIIDTPGMREVGLATVSTTAVEQHFQEILDLARACRFNDCQHKSEPNCAVKEALLDGSLDQDLFKRYRKMEKEIAYLKRKERFDKLLKH